ncbi:MAG: DNA repair protein RecN, partial [Rhodospirillales bacterium]|nr:DNA repair protein RecN [Rhodospirillales bacterium]
LLDKASHEVDLNPQHLEMVEERLFALRGLARKHNTNVDSLADLLEALRGQLMAVEDGGAALEKMRREEAAARAAFLRAAEKLGQARRKAAKAMDGAVARELAPLKLEKAKFSTLIDTLDEDAWSEGGCEKVAFQVATNPGAPPGPLNKIASGGELARFTLALKVVLAKADPVPSLVFDEVDSGIGGAVADAVGERLSKMASDVQVLVVTHSPQVAARGTHHWQVSKSEAKGIVLTSVDILSEPERQEEIARMLAGAKITDEARAAASSLLQGRGP